MAKNARWGQNTAPTLVLAAGSAEAHQLLGGKTLAQVGAEFDLGDEDVQWGYGTNPRTQDEIRSLVLTINGKMFQIPVSRNMTAEIMNNPSTMLACMFRSSFLSVKDPNGMPTHDDSGNVVLDQSKPYLSFGRPAGIVIDRLESVFNEPVGEGENASADATADAAGA